MTSRPALRLQLMTTALAVGMVAALLLSLNGFWRQTFPTGLLWVLALASGALAWLGWHRPGGLVALILALLGAGVAVVPLDAFLNVRYGYDGLAAPASAVSNLVLLLSAWFTQIRSGQFETMAPQVALLFLCVVALLAALAINWEAFARGDTFWSLVFGAALFGLQWALFWDRAERYLVGYIACGLTLWSLAHSTHRSLRWAAEGRRTLQRPVWTAGVGAALLVVVSGMVLPATFRPVDLGYTAERLREAFPVLQRLRGGFAEQAATRFNLRLVGFGGDASILGGPTRLAGGTALRLELPVPARTPMYLRGTVRKVYTGQGWSLPPDPGIAADGSRRPAITLNGAAAARWQEVQVVPVGLYTDTLFHLLEPNQIRAVPQWRFDEDGNLVAAALRGSDDPYTFVSRVPVPSVDQARQLGRALRGDEAEDWAPYLALPDEPELASVAELTRQVVAGLEHPMDQALAVESFLRANYPYDLNPPRPRPRDDFVAQFLFETRQGYCVYHSTAMAVMLRTLGIPTRWVEGFVALPNGTAVLEISNDQAHAWVEAWIEGYGWVTFDPTPRADFPPVDRSYVPPAAGEATGSPGESTPPPGPSALDRLRGEAEATSGEPGAGAGRNPGPWPWAAGGIAVLALAGWAWWRWREPSLAADPRLALQQSFQQTGRLLGWFGYGPAPAMTAQEYAGALSAAWPELSDQIQAVADQYQAARYGPPDLAVSADAVQQARLLRRRAWVLLQNRFGRAYCHWRLLWARRLGSYFLTEGQLRHSPRD